MVSASVMHYNPRRTDESSKAANDNGISEVPILDTFQDGENVWIDEDEEIHLHFLEDIYDTIEGPVRKAWR